jgi:site-specific recombinase XerD
MYIQRTVNRLNTLDGKTKTEIVVGTPKSERAVRAIPFTPAVKKVFLNYQAKYMEILGIKFISKNDYVVAIKRGYPVEPKTMQTAFERIIKDAGIEKTNFHALRHTFATRAIEKGVDVKTLSVLLGHADVTTTLNRYAHVLDEQKRKTMAILLSDYDDKEEINFQKQ